MKKASRKKSRHFSFFTQHKGGKSKANVLLFWEHFLKNQTWVIRVYNTHHMTKSWDCWLNCQRDPTGRVDVFSVHFRNNLEYFVIKWRHFFRTFSKEIDSFHKKEETLFRSIVGVNFTVLIGNDLKLNHEEKKMFYRYFFGENWNYFMRKWRHFLRA